ncbi:MAG: cytochrome c biogenesis protein CcsA [Gammaproteobacteria bacterium]|nr:cytochrome c biogenesis protein CcsA [Gammaproteobacteria bacterium]
MDAYQTVVSNFTILLYASAGAIIWRQLLRGQASETGHNKIALACGTAAVVLHAVVLFYTLQPHTTLNVALTNMISLVAWVIAVQFLITVTTKPVTNLGIIVMPLGALTLLAQEFWPGMHLLPAQSSSYLAVHVIVSLVAYSLLSLATVQSMLLLVQESRLHHKQAGRMIRALPPIETMESLMVGMVWIGFILLTITVITGIFFSEETFGQPLKFTHHIFLSLLAWIVYTLFLFGRWRFGWRGRKAVIWVMSAGILLALAYFGTKFVTEYLLHR